MFYSPTVDKQLFELPSKYIRFTTCLPSVHSLTYGLYQHIYKARQILHQQLCVGLAMLNSCVSMLFLTVKWLKGDFVQRSSGLVSSRTCRRSAGSPGGRVCEASCTTTVFREEQGTLLCSARDQRLRCHHSEELTPLANPDPDPEI